MKVNGSITPPRFTLETNPRRPNFRLARFHANAIETENGWEYDEYCLEFPTSDTLEAEIEAHYGEYLKRAMEAEGASEAEYISVARNAALERINGKCSIAIASGIDYNGKHYSLTETKQGYINNAYLEVLGGATQVKLAADGEDVTWHTATQITELFHKATDWGKICIYYKGYLFAWVGTETSTAVLATIDYGTTLPSAYATGLTTKLSEESIDITKYTTALTGG